MIGENLSSKALFALIALGINLALFALIPQLSGDPGAMAPHRLFDAIFLSRYEPPPPPPAQPKQSRPKPKIPEKPRTLPKRTVKPEPIKPRPPRQVQVEMPKMRFEINPKLSTGLAIKPPPPLPKPKKIVKKAPPVPAPKPKPDPEPAAPAPAPAPTPDPARVQSVPSEFALGEVDQAPRVVKQVKPMYPFRARRRNISGQVVVKFLVDDNGRVTRPSVVEADPQGVFEKSALQAVRQWRFSPGKYKGRAVATWVELPIRFSLSG
jgi:protein TonB